MTNTEELLPCPFCGGEATAGGSIRKHYGEIYRVGCDKKGCAGWRWESVTYKSREAAIEAWNTRAEQTCHAIAIYNMNDEWCSDKCSACDYEWYEDEPNYCPNCGAKVITP